MSLHNFNSSNKSWKMYSKIITSINSDDLNITPYDGKDLLLEVSGNNNIIFKKGTNSYILDNLINGSGGGGGGTGIINGGDASFSNVDVSVNLNPLTINSGSIGINGKPRGNAYIRDLSITNIDISGNLNPLIPNRGSIGINGDSWGNAYINDLSVNNNIDVSGNVNPTITNNGSIGIVDKHWNEAHINRLVVYKGLTDTLHKIKYLRWNTTFNPGSSFGSGNAGPYPVGGLTYTKSLNTILAVETSFSYTFNQLAAGADVLYSFLRLTYGTTTINGNQVQQRWGDAGGLAPSGTGTRSATLPECCVFLDASNVSGVINIGLLFTEGPTQPFLDDPPIIRQGYFKVTETWA